jgi:hypothetical protein
MHSSSVWASQPAEEHRIAEPLLCECLHNNGYVNTNIM